MSRLDTVTQVVLVDDHQLIRAGIRALIDELDGFSVVAEAGTAEKALVLTEKHAPTLIVTDISLPGMSGLDLLLQLRERKSEAKVVVLSMHATPDFVMSALKAGANGYLVKDAAAAELEITLRAVMVGQSYLSPAVSQMVVDQMLSRENLALAPQLAQDIAPELRAAARPPLAAVNLTPRQSQILTLIAQGMSTKQIAWSLGLSVKTIESHRLLLMERLSIHDVASLTHYAIRNGLVTM